MYNFKYIKALSLEDARAKFLKSEDAIFLAGGMTLIPAMRQRLSAPTSVVDLSALEELKVIEVGDKFVKIGAMVTHSSVARSHEIAKHFPALVKLAEGIGDPMVRNRGTIGGSLANNDPAADYPAVVLACDAIIHTVDRDIPAEKYFKGLFETALKEGEIITAVSFPIPKRAFYSKFPNPVSGYALAAVFAAETDSGIRIAVTGAGPGVFRVEEMEQALDKNFSPQAVRNIKLPANGLNKDMHASAEYRAHLVTIMAERAVKGALDDGKI